MIKKENKRIKVLSLFDGISCGRVALERAGFEIEKYYASEIDKFAIQIAQKNYPDTVQLGDVKDINEFSYPFNCGEKVDIVFGGSPCQGFSFAGKQLNFDDSRSALFFEFVRILKEVKPKYFLLENVKMKQEWKDIISKELGVEPILINSSRLSSQSRERLYWTNIPNVEQPEEKNLVIADVLGIEPTERHNRILMTKSNFKVKVRKNYINTLELGKFLRENKNISIKKIAEYCQLPKTKVEHWFRLDNSFAIPDENSWGKLKELFKFNDTWDKKVTEFEIKNNVYDMAKRIYHINGKHPTLTTLTGGHQRKTITDGKEMFYLTPLHTERLQNLPDDYTKGFSNRQRFKATGNGWTVDVLAHIFKNMK